MKYGLFVRKLLLRKDRYITSEEIKKESAKLGMPYEKAIKYLYLYHYVNRIVRGFFYIPTVEERKYKTGGPNFYEAISKAMKYKKVKNWYFGLESAIKLNNITHEFFTIDYIISDKIFRSKPITILGRKVKFVKLNKKFFGFGIKKIKNTRYSDLEKTILDIIHIRKYAGKSNKTIRDYVIEWADEADKNKIKKYSKHYSKSARNTLEELK
jgi:predicted transcriptional regulator of viral defense system